jgi:hypothetical protein
MRKLNPSKSWKRFQWRNKPVWLPKRPVIVAQFLSPERPPALQEAIFRVSIRTRLGLPEG